MRFFRRREKSDQKLGDRLTPGERKPTKELVHEVEWVGVKYRLEWFENIPDGCAGFTLTKPDAGPDSLACMTYWDAMAQFFLEMTASELPLVVVEWMIFQSKREINHTTAVENGFKECCPDIRFLKTDG